MKKIRCRFKENEALILEVIKRHGGRLTSHIVPSIPGSDADEFDAEVPEENMDACCADLGKLVRGYSFPS